MNTWKAPIAEVIARMKERLGTACFGSADADDAERLIEEYERMAVELATTEAARQLATKALQESLAEIERLDSENYSLRAERESHISALSQAITKGQHDYEALEAERGTARDALEDYKSKLWCALGQPLNIEYIEAVKQLRANLARMQGPVTDEEWAYTRPILGSHGPDSMRAISRVAVNALLAARAGKGNEHAE